MHARRPAPEVMVLRRRRAGLMRASAVCASIVGGSHTGCRPHSKIQSRVRHVSRRVVWHLHEREIDMVADVAAM